MQSHFKLEGYVLALIYLELRRQSINMTLKVLENAFHISSLTISNRKNEIEEIIKKGGKN